MPRRGALPLAALLLLSLATAAWADRVALHAATLRAGEPLPALQGPAATDALRILQFDHAPGRRDRDRIEGVGARILGYLPDDAYLLRAEDAVLARLAALPGVDLLTDYRASWRVAPRARVAARDAAGPLTLTALLADGAPVRLRADQAAALGARVERTADRERRPRLWLSAPAGALDALSALPDLLWLEPAAELSDRMSRVPWIVQSGIWHSTPVWDHGIHGEGQIVGHIDSQLDDTVCWFADPEGDPIGPDHRKIVYRGPQIAHGQTHGTHTAGILCGDAAPIDETMGTQFRGMAWAARMAHSDYQETGYDLYGDLVTHYEHGARVHSNSWGSSEQAYTALCADIDAFSHDYEESVVLFAVANGAIGAPLGSPENAKDVVGVAAAHIEESVGDFNAHANGGSGPTQDGRRKPEVFTPGAGVWAADSEADCGLRAISGTSMACPSAAGAVALIRQYLTDGFYPSGAATPADSLAPSGALLRALLMNATVPMDSFPPGYPNDVEGWGRVLLDDALFFAGDSRELWLADRRNAEGLDTGDRYIYRIQVETAGEPLAVTLAFTDPPAQPGALTPVVNDLDLEVVGPDGLFLGNVFDVDAGESMPGGDPDALNMVERVLVKAPTPGEWEIRVRGRRVPLGPQGYGLAVNGDLGESVTAYLEDPAFVRLENPFPNPFVAGGGATLSLRAELRADQSVALRIYDVAGRRVARLGGAEQGGEVDLRWDGRDDDGNPAASGIYFARLETAGGGVSQAARILLLR